MRCVGGKGLIALLFVARCLELAGGVGVTGLLQPINYIQLQLKHSHNRRKIQECSRLLMTIYPICLYLGCWEQLFVFLTQAPLKMTIQQWLFSRCVRGNHLPPAPGAWSICFGRVRETDGVTTKLGGAGFAT